MKILDTAIKQGPILNFQNPLPVKGNNVTEKKCLLLEVQLQNHHQTQSLTVEISLLEDYSYYTEENIKESFSNIKDQLKNIDLKSAIELVLNQNMPSPLIHAFEVIKFKSLNKTEFQPIKVRGLNNSKHSAFKLKISKNNLNKVLDQLKDLHSSDNQIQITLDANRQLNHEDWNQFFKEYKTLNNSKNIQLIVEEPLPFHLLIENNFFQLFEEHNIQIAVDEGLAEWYFQGLDENEINKRLSIYRYIVFKPGMLTLSQIENLLKTSDHIGPQNVILSCLYDGPWNLAYFFYLSSKLNLSQPAGLSPLLTIKENVTSLQLNESAGAISLIV